MGSDGYGGLIGAFPYAARRSASWLFRGYVILAALVGLLVVVVVSLGVIKLLATTGRAEGTSAFVRGFYLLVGVTVVVPIVAPVLLVARRHRRTGSSPPRYDRAMAGAGFLFILLLYVGLVASTPPARQEAVRPIVVAIGETRVEIALTRTVAEWLYALPRVGGVLFPALGAVLIVLIHRRTR
ncbi:MAG: hypothetical protein ABEJ35_04465 [Halobacteriaceae archaeon]